MLGSFPLSVLPCSFLRLDSQKWGSRFRWNTEFSLLRTHTACGCLSVRVILVFLPAPSCPRSQQCLTCSLSAALSCKTCHLQGVLHPLGHFPGPMLQPGPPAQSSLSPAPGLLLPPRDRPPGQRVHRHLGGSLPGVHLVSALGQLFQQLLCVHRSPSGSTTKEPGIKRTQSFKRRLPFTHLKP